MATISELEKRIQDLEERLNKKDAQQITLPLDIVSQDIIFGRVVKFSSKSASTITADKSIKVVVDGQAYQINVL
jgi:hypothetical protein